MILANLNPLIEAETCVLRLRNTPSETLEVRGAKTHRDPVWMEEILALDALIAGDLRPEKGALRIDKLRDSKYYRENLASDSLLAIALEIDGNVLGTLTLYDRKSADSSRAGFFSDQDREVLLDFGTQAAKGLKRFLPLPSWSPVAGL
jgi:GAF domain